MFLLFLPRKVYVHLQFDSFQYSLKKIVEIYLKIETLTPINSTFLLFFLSFADLIKGTSALRLLTHIIQGFPKSIQHQVLTDIEKNHLGSSISVILTDTQL